MRVICGAVASTPPEHLLSDLQNWKPVKIAGKNRWKTPPTATTPSSTARNALHVDAPVAPQQSCILRTGKIIVPNETSVGTFPFQTPRPSLKIQFLGREQAGRPEIWPGPPKKPLCHVRRKQSHNLAANIDGHRSCPYNCKRCLSDQLTRAND